VYSISLSQVSGCLHDPANVQLHDPANVQQMYSKYTCYCWTFAGSCKHPITHLVSITISHIVSQQTDDYLPSRNNRFLTFYPVPSHGVGLKSFSLAALCELRCRIHFEMRRRSRRRTTTARDRELYSASQTSDPSTGISQDDMV